MCDKVSRLDRRKDDEEQFYADASFIVKKSFFRFIKGYPREEYTPSWPEPHRCVYPKANSYYVFHEDSNPFARFPSKCESRKYGNVQAHYEPAESPYETRDPYRETEAREKFLQNNPTSFVIFGKPGLNTAKLAAMIAHFWNCVLISPLSLVKEEIERGTEKGKTIAEILKTGECLGPDVIMNLIESRLNKRDVLHRGYVVEGLPLVPNEEFDYSSYPSYEKEETEARELAQNFAELFDSSFHRICDTVIDFDKSNASRKVSISRDEESKNKICAIKPRYERAIPDQIENIFTAWLLKPTIIIYVMCPDADVVRKREYFRLDPTTGRDVDTSFAEMSKNIGAQFSRDRSEHDINVSFELYQELMSEERILDERQKMYLLRRPCDRKSNAEAQCELYKRFAISIIERWILLHKPENVIRVDGRSPVSRVFQNVVARLRILPVPRVILPRRLADIAIRFEGESSAVPLTMDEFEGKSSEEAFQILSNRDTISPLYPWRLSSWKFLCPVELARGRTVEGIPKYAVRFMNNIFFLSSNKAAELFIENPRTFLSPFVPRPTCKIAVFSPMYAVESDLCRKLAQTFRGTIINVVEIGKSLVDIDPDVFFDLFSQTNLVEKANIVVNKIQGIPKEKIDTEVWRDGGYIIDGMHPDLDSWKTIIEEWSIIFEDVILLFDEEPYEYLLSKWHNINDPDKDSRRFEDLEEGYGEYSEGREYEEASESLAEYLKYIRNFHQDWEKLREEVARTCRNLITCNLNEVKDVPKYVIERIRDRYTDKARIMSDEEKEREKDLAEYMAMTEDTEIVEEDEEREDEEQTMELDVKEDNPRLGDTNRFCPVALTKYNILWKGNEDSSAIFMGKIYHLSSAGALEEFVSDPRKCLVPFRKPLSKIPPLRISILGSLGSGKSTLADAISRAYGLVHIDYLNSFAAYAKDRGMQPVSRRDFLIDSEDPEEAELPEDLHDERYNSDEATVQSFIRRYWRTGGILPKKMLHGCLLQFFEGLYNFHGVVLEQFPSCPDDVETMLKHYTVPELIIELRCSKDKARERLMPELFAFWRNKLEEKKREASERYEEEVIGYERNQEIWIEKMLSEAFDGRNEYRAEEFSTDDEDENEFSAEEEESRDDVTSEIVELKRFELYEIWQQENPEPVLFSDWENFETAKERIEQKFEETYENDSRKVEATRSALENESIPYIVIDGERSSREVILQVMRILNPYVIRDPSILEKVHTIDLETAEMLLDCGYYLLSSFGRWCPVQLSENKIPVNMFLPLEAEQELYPAIHRQFVYFLSSKNAHSAFSKNPLAYLEQDSRAPIVPLRLSIIGPPKCGKTTLALRFARKYGLKVITRGAALRHVLKYFPWTESARIAESRLRAGQLVPEKALFRAVETYSLDPRSTSQGFVLDGFPSSRQEFEELTFLGLQPMITLDLQADFAFCFDCSSLAADETNKPPNFSEKFLERRYANWAMDQGSFRGWLKRFTQNVVELDGTRSTWHVWRLANREVCRRYTKIRRYFRESDYDKAHSLEFMSVSPYEFRRRQSLFESYCPICLFQENSTKTSGPPPDHRGMVQFREHFYWICPLHLNQFAEDPEKYVPPNNTARLPEDRPRILTETVDKEHSCWARRLKVEGYCLVTYVDNLPNRELVPGKTTIGVLYRDNVYLFCSEECRDKFLTQWDKYASVDVKFPRTMSPIDVKDLPDLGFLEQTVAKIVIDAVNEISVTRPKLPGLSPSVTAAIFIGVYLKTNNACCALKETEIYETVQRRMFGRVKILRLATRTMKKKINPFVDIPKHEYDKLTRRVPVPDARFDYLCEYFKPASKVPAFLNVVDIAGLVKGASEGQGLGNSFLSHINACDGIFHLCRAFDDDDVTHVEGDVDPVRDLGIISEELRLKDIEFLNGHLEKLEKLVVRGNDKKLKPEYDTLLKVKGVMVDEKRHIRFADWSATDIEVLNKYLFLTSKPVIYLVNLSEKDYIRKKNKWLIKIKEWVDKNDPGAVLIPFSGVFENKLLDMNEAERGKYLEENKVTSALDKIIVQGYKALQLQYFFTAGHDEVKAWTIQKGTKAPQAAGKIHTDFEKGFIMAEVMKFDDFKNEGSEAAVKAAGKYRQQGRNYVVEDGDIIFFKFNAGAGLKDAKKK